MRTTPVIALAAAALAILAGCGDDSAGPAGGVSIETLLVGLECPKGLWVRGDLVYVTETAGRNSPYGGVVRLDSYDMPSGVKRILTENPENCDAVVVAASGNVYLASPEGPSPGSSGNLSVVNPLSGLETHLADLGIAATDMAIDEANDIYLVGSNDFLDARSLQLLPAGAYASPVLLKAGLGRVACVAKNGSDIYYSTPLGTFAIAGDGSTELLADRPFASISCSVSALLYADPAAGTVGAIGLLDGGERVIASRLRSPVAVRWQPEERRLFFLEAGSQAGELRDGTLKVVYGL